MDGWILFAVIATYAPIFFMNSVRLWHCLFVVLFVPLLVLASCYFGVLSEFASGDLIFLVRAVTISVWVAFLIWLSFRVYVFFKFGLKLKSVFHL